MQAPGALSGQTGRWDIERVDIYEQFASCRSNPAIPRPTPCAKEAWTRRGMSGDEGSAAMAPATEELRALAAEALEERRLQIAAQE